MAPSVGHVHKLVVKNVRLLKTVWHRTAQLVQSNVSALRSTNGGLQPIPVRVTTQPVHPLAALRQSKSRWFSTQASRLTRQYGTSAGSGARGVKYDRSLFPKSRTATAVNISTGRAPFASTLRPNLTGGTLSRTAGGYSWGSGRVNGARYFSHTPAAPAQVVQNVSQAIRTFCLSGQKAQFDGVDPATGGKRYRAISSSQETACRKMAGTPKATPGSYVEFHVNPTITALTPFGVMGTFSSSKASFEMSMPTLNTEGLLDVLSTDFSRTLKDLAIILEDLKLLSDLGDLPITYPTPDTLRIHFPGCDSDTVSCLCLELGIRRGVVVQDADFDSFAGTEIALMFPFAPSKTPSEARVEDFERFGFAIKRREPIQWQRMISKDGSAEEYSTQSDSGLELLDTNEPLFAENLWDHDTSSMADDYESAPQDVYGLGQSSSPLEYQDFQGIHRFIEVCDAARRQP